MAEVLTLRILVTLIYKKFIRHVAMHFNRQQKVLRKIHSRSVERINYMTQSDGIPNWKGMALLMHHHHESLSL